MNTNATFHVVIRLELAPDIVVLLDTAVQERMLVTQHLGLHKLEIMVTALRRLLKLIKIVLTHSMDTLVYQNMYTKVSLDLILP